MSRQQPDDGWPIERTKNKYALQCPSCDGTHLHQVGIELYRRWMEDSDRGIALNEQNGDVSITHDVSSEDGNPSTRRDGLILKMQCEHCHSSADDEYYELAVAQHKGEEFLSWNHADSRIDSN